MATYPPQELAQHVVCQSHTGHVAGLWFLPIPAFKAGYKWMKQAVRYAIFFTPAACKAVYRYGRGISPSIGYESKFFGPVCHHFRIVGTKITGVGSNFLLEFPTREIVLKIWKFSKITVTFFPTSKRSLTCSRSGYQVSLMVVASMILEPDGLELPILVLVSLWLIHSTTKFLLIS